jgi:hypothetical protein
MHGLIKSCTSNVLSASNYSYSEQHSPSPEANNWYSGQEIPNILRKPKVQYYLDKNMQLTV